MKCVSIFGVIGLIGENIVDLLGCVVLGIYEVVVLIGGWNVKWFVE